MNGFAAYTQRVPGGWRIMLRFPRDGHPKPIMDSGDKPLILSCKLEATETALKHILAYNNGNYRRDGETLSTTLSAKKQLDQLFMGGGKVVQIERKAVKA